MVLNHSSLSLIPFQGLLVTITGQFLRTKAMIDAGSAFTHKVADQKTLTHKFVQTGLYGRIRHPSYSGFYLWALGTQLLLGNMLCLVAFVLVLHRFFKERIKCEEFHLIKFFPGEYSQYKRQCWSGIPFID